MPWLLAALFYAGFTIFQTWPLVTRLHDEIVKILRTKEVSDRIAEDGAEPVGNMPEEMRKMMNADVIKWAKLVKESGAKLD